ncbi:hypothetical protein B0H14DRAFT_2564517 [Mycena olivaceomarginata]|nr:hypothetical protein B0H14DRAFT_2564517 [Mycena olivaceomarginata]
MFSKVLAFGLGAVALARAASLQTPMLMCNINLGTSAGPVKSFSALDPGVYNIYNVASTTQLRSYTRNQPIFISYTREFPGPFGEWKVDPAGSDGFTITNQGLATPTYIDDAGNIVAGTQPPEIFAINRAADGAFVVQRVNEDQVWTADGSLGTLPCDAPAPKWIRGAVVEILEDLNDPLNAPSYNDQSGSIPLSGLLAIYIVVSVVHVLNSISGVLVVPVVGTIIAQAAVVFAQRRRPKQNLSLVQLFALTDRGWGSIPTLWNAHSTGKSSSFLWVAALMTMISTVPPRQPIQSALISFELITVMSCLDLPLVGRCTIEFPVIAAYDAEPVSFRTTSFIVTVSALDLQPNLWVDNPYANVSKESADIFPVFGWGLPWYLLRFANFTLRLSSQKHLLTDTKSDRCRLGTNELKSAENNENKNVVGNVESAFATLGK